MKKLLIIALALMLALSLVACNNKDGNEDETGNNTIIINPDGTNNAVGTGDPSTGNNGDSNTPGNTDPVEEIFTDKEQTVFITADVASIRSEARIAEETLINYATKDTEFKSTGYSANWYRIEYEVVVEETSTEAATDEAAPASEEATTEATTEAATEAETEAAPKTQTVIAYVHTSVAYVKDMTATDLEEPMTLYIIASALYVRSYYNFDIEENKMCTLQQGDEVQAVAKGNGWYKIKLADDAQGNEQFGYISSNEKYVSTTKPAETTEAAE